MSIILDGTSGVTTPGVTNTGNETVSGNETITGTLTASNFNAASTFGFKNRIINGAMVIDQRNAGASVTANGYTLDRWRLYNTQSSKLTIQQNAGSVTPPAGFINYLGMTSSSAYTVTSTDVFQIYQWIEGYNIADFDWGKSTAKTVTLSFVVRSSLTGTFGGALQNGAGNRSYPFSYTISSANTWETKTITITGDTSGTWTTDNTAGVAIIFCYGAGSTNAGTAGAWTGSALSSATGATSVVGTNGATFYITGVQLEVGSKATTFDTRAYGQELALCQRYYYKVKNDTAGVEYNVVTVGAFSSTRAFGTFVVPVPLRANPTFTFNSCAIRSPDTSVSANVTNIYPVQTVTVVPYPASVPFEVNVASGMTSNVWYGLAFQASTNDYLAVSAEL